MIAHIRRHPAFYKQIAEALLWVVLGVALGLWIF